jgi:hypothetical protein
VTPVAVVIVVRVCAVIPAILDLLAIGMLHGCPAGVKNKVYRLKILPSVRWQDFNMYR